MVPLSRQSAARGKHLGDAFKIRPLAIERLGLPQQPIGRLTILPAAGQICRAHPDGCVPRIGGCGIIQRLAGVVGHLAALVSAGEQRERRGTLRESDGSRAAAE